MRVFIDFSDGRRFWSEAHPEADPRHSIEVPDSTVALWREIAGLDAAVQVQLRQLDNEIWKQSEDT